MADRHECDVLVAGSGAAGFTAALTARHHGLDVVIAEKEPEFGGTTAYSAGVIWIPHNRHAEREGVADSPEAAMTYLEAEIGNRLDRDKAEAFIREGREMLAFLEANSHVRYIVMPTWADYHPKQPGGAQGGRSLLPVQYDGRALGDWFRKLRAPLPTMMIFGGMMVGRDDLPHLLNCTRSAKSAWYVAKILARQAMDRLSYSRGTRIANGNALIARMAKSAFEAGIPLWLSAPIVELVTEDGRVTGAVVEREGRRVEVRARRGVVLACGGFPANDELKARYYGHLADGKNHRSLPPPGNTGDGIRVAQAIGARFHDDQHHPAAWTPVSLVPQKDGTEKPFPHFIDRGKPGVIAVDRRGKRFWNEADSYHDFTPAMIGACRDDPAVEAWLISDHRAVKRYGLGAAPPSPKPIAPFVKSGYLLRADTLGALAARAGIDAAALEATVARVNQFAAKGEDPDFDKGNNAYNHFNGDPLNKPNPCIGPISTPPYYAVKIIPGDIGTFLGLAADGRARVLDTDGEPIPGLYAAGNDMASVMGGTYPGAGITIGPAMTFGYIAGNELAGETAAPD